MKVKEEKDRRKDLPERDNRWGVPGTRSERRADRREEEASERVMVDEKDKSGLEDSHDVAAASRHSLPVWAELLTKSKS